MTLFKLFAGTDVGLRDNNEDNFTVCPDLSKNEWMVPANQQEAIPLGSKGCIMVVADGMGGMNAGEVASDIAIKTVEQMFSTAKMPVDVTKKPESIKAYLKKVIICADLNVKQKCKEDPSTEGMGSTIVIAWLIGNNVYIGWMGDSRAYSYIPGKGLSRLSKDHSYVQELVDAKMLTEEEAMMHPQSNVIIRSLGDATEKAKPDIVCHPIAKDEILLLCSDGLCGVCTDATIAEIIKQESGDLRVCKEKLTNAALEAEGSDNITISLLQIVAVENAAKKEGDKEHLTFTTWQNISFVIFALGLAAALGFAGLRTCSFPKNPDNEQVDSAKAEMEKGGHKDSIKVDSAKNKMQEDKTSPKGGKQTLKDRINDSKKDIRNSTTSEENSSSEPTPTDGSGTSSVTPVPITE